jgi:hypothetical protein
MCKRKKASLGPPLASALGLLCAACAGWNPYDAEHRYEDGWRPGIVERVAPASSIEMKGAKDCRAAAPSETRFAVVWYRRNHMMRALVLPISPGAEPRPHTWVLVRPESCSPPAAIAANP